MNRICVLLLFLVIFNQTVLCQRDQKFPKNTPLLPEESVENSKEGQINRMSPAQGRRYLRKSTESQEYRSEEQSRDLRDQKKQHSRKESREGYFPGGKEQARLQKQNAKAEKHRQKTIKKIIQLVIVVVVIIGIIVVLLILKPIFIRWRQRREATNPQHNSNINQRHTNPPNHLADGSKTIIIQKQTKIEYYKARFLNVDQVRNSQQAASNTQIEGEDLRRTPTFGEEITFRHKN